MTAYVLAAIGYIWVSGLVIVALFFVVAAISHGLAQRRIHQHIRAANVACHCRDCLSQSLAGYGWDTEQVDR